MPSHPPGASQSLLADSTLRVGLGVAACMAAAIVGTLFGGRLIDFASLGLFVIAIVYCAFCQPRLGLPIYISYSAMEGMYKYTSGFSQIVYGVKPFLEITLLVGLLFVTKSQGRRLKSPPLSTLVGLLAGWGLILIFHPHGAGAVAGVAQAVVWYIAPMLFFWTAYNGTHSLRQVEMICYTVIAVAVVVSLFTFVQYSMGQAWTTTHLPGYEKINQGEWWVTNSKGNVTDTSWRPASTSSIGGGGALWGMFGLMIGLGLLLSGQISKTRKTSLLISLGINVLGIVLSSVRLYLIDSIIVAVLMFIMLSRSQHDLTRNLGMLVVVGTVCWIAFTMAQQTSKGMISSRYASTLANPIEKYNTDRSGIGARSAMVLDTLQNFPLGIGYQRGTGLGTQNTENENAVNRDDEFNNIAADMGWAGLILLMALIVTCIQKGLQTLKAMVSQHNRALGAIFFSLMITYFVAFFGGPSLSGADTFWIFLALLLVMPVMQRREGSVLEASPLGASGSSEISR